MKKILTLLGLGLIFAVNVHAKPQFISLESSSSTYANGASAILTAHILIQPTNPNNEIFLAGSLDHSVGRMKLTRLSAGEAVSITPALTEAGTYTWHVDFYLQNKSKAQALETAIAACEDDNLRINRALQTETDPAIRNQLQADLQRNNNVIDRSRNQLWTDRRGLGSTDLTFTVNTALTASPHFEDPVLGIEADHANASYQVGERATFYVHSLTDWEGQEILAFAGIDGNSSSPGLEVERKRLGDRDFAFTSPIFASPDVGSRIFSAHLKIRPKAQADSIRGSMSLAIERRSYYISERDATIDPEKAAYYSKLIVEMDLTIQELNRQLGALLTDVGSGQNFFFNILPSLDLK